MLAEPSPPEAVLPRVASLVAASVADLCLVDLVAPDGLVVRVATEHGDAALGDRAWQLRRFPADIDDPREALGEVVRTGRSLLVPDARAGWLEESVHDDEYRELLASLGVSSLVAAPLAWRGERFGVMTLASVDGARRLGVDHLRLAEELARRAAQAVHCARSHPESPAVAGRDQIEFLAVVSHEFRTPVHVASMFTELLLMGVPEPIPPAARKHVEHIRTATRHLDELVHQLLTFSRLEGGRESLHDGEVDLVALARETAGLIEPLAAQKSLGYVVDLPSGVGTARTDANKVRQILFNLLGNAVKFTESGEVRLTMRVEAGRAIFEVRDSGIGIAPEHREMVFEPFWQVDRESRPGLKGAGLGLGIVRRLVGLLGGEITVESAAGMGSLFRVTLPVRGDQ